jgi:hypothetical protein
MIMVIKMCRHFDHISSSFTYQSRVRHHVLLQSMFGREFVIALTAGVLSLQCAIVTFHVQIQTFAVLERISTNLKN